MIKNKHKCPPKIWAKFTDIQKQVYNNFVSDTKNNQQVYRHAKASTENPAHWAVTVHNMGCAAAWSLKGVLLV